MQRLFSMFPAGVPGLALLVLRNCIAAALASSALPDGWQHTAFLILLGMLVIGMFTPVVCALASAVVVLCCLHTPLRDSATIVVVVLSALSLACIGPGAFSVDGWLFGRRVVLSTSASTTTDDEQP
jgi:hypothetical protein